jgi:hypothetical protein
MLVRAITHPFQALQKVKDRGFGRTVTYFAKLMPGPFYEAFVGLVKPVKIMTDPLEFFRRRSLAAKLARNSAYREFFPEDKAFKIAPPGTFKAVDDIVPVARRVYADFMSAHPDGKANATPYSYLLCDYKNGPADGNITDLKSYPEFQDLALFRPFVEMAAKYLGEVPILSSVFFQVVAPNDSTVGFQRFHIDKIDRRQFKIFIAIEDVDEGNGATIILPADVSAALSRSINHHFGRIADEVIYSEKWEPHIKLAAGPSGSAFLFDTCRVVHCGARTRTKPRVIIQLQYVSKYSQAEGPGQLGRVIFDRSRARDEVDRLVLGS